MEKHDSKNKVTAGASLESAERVVILVHGRGGTARDILQLAGAFPASDICWIAPQATNNTWYPHSFMQPISQNEPWFSSAINMLDEILDEVKKQGFSDDQIYFMGFSQGACLALDFAARRASKYGGMIAFSGGLIGKEINPEHYRDGFDGASVYIGCSDYDPHIPESRVHDSEAQLEKLGAKVNAVIYPGMGHTITDEEIEEARKILK